MKKAVPILVVLLGLAIYAYVSRIRPSRVADSTVRGSGTVEATELSVAPKIGGRIQAVNAAEGDHVTAGQLLVVLECDDLEARKAQAEAQVVQADAAQAQAEASLAQVTAQSAPLVVQRDLATREYQRTLSLSKSAAVPERNLDQAQAALKAAEEQLKATELAAAVARRAIAVAASQVQLARRSVDLAALQVGECSLAAPQAGTVTARVREPGEMALPGASILRLAHLDEVYTWIYVANEEVGRVKLGHKVKLVADTYPDRALSGTVTRINEQAEFTPRSIQTKQDRTRLVFGVKVTVPNPDHALMPGMPVEAEIVEAEAPAISERP